MRFHTAEPSKAKTAAGQHGRLFPIQRWQHPRGLRAGNRPVVNSCGDLRDHCGDINLHRPFMSHIHIYHNDFSSLLICLRKAQDTSVYGYKTDGEAVAKIHLNFSCQQGAIGLLKIRRAALPSEFHPVKGSFTYWQDRCVKAKHEMGWNWHLARPANKPSQSFQSISEQR